MTRRAGFVRVPLTAQGARRVGRWLASRVTDAGRNRDTLLTVGPDPERMAALNGVVVFMARAARFERTHVEIPREMAALVASEVRLCQDAEITRQRLVGVASFLALDQAVVRLARDCHAALKGRGRPRLTRGQQQEWIKSGQGDERELRRLKKRERFDKRIDRAIARGLSLLTADLNSDS